MHEDALVREISLEHAGMGVSHPNRNGVVIHLEDNDVLQLVPFFLANIDFSAGKLIDHLVAIEERHWVTRGQVINGAAQFLLRGGGHRHIEPETRGRAEKRDGGQRDADPRNADAIGAQSNQFVIRRKAAEHEQDGR